MRCLLERCPPYEVFVRRSVRIMRCLLGELSAIMRCLLESCPPYEVAVREMSSI